MALLFKGAASRVPWWLEEFKRQAPDLDVRIWPEAGDADEIEFALVWQPPPGELRRYRNLKAVFSLGAGVDHLWSDPDLPRVPITRIVDVYLTSRMTEYVVLQVLRHHRQQMAYEAQQREHLWRELKQPSADQRTVGIMGLGTLGRDSGRKLKSLGFTVIGWSRTRKTLAGIKSYAGAAEMAAFLAKTDILVCLLPLTRETEGMLDASTLAMLPDGASFVNVARGAHVIEADLLAALDSGRLSHATLDVFREEPLPETSPFWSHPRVTITPHVASYTDPRTVVSQVIENMARAKAGKTLLHLVNVDLGY